jgi:hypothetical protein
MTAPLAVCTKDKHRAIVRFFLSEEMRGAEIQRQLAATCGQNCLPQKVCVDMLKSSQTCVVGVDRQGHPSTSTNEQNMKRAQAKILGNCRVTTAEIAAILGINVARPWCKPPVQQPSLRHTHSAQVNYTRSMSLFDPELQYDQASAVLPIMQRKYSNTALF